MRKVQTMTVRAGSGISTTHVLAPKVRKYRTPHYIARIRIEVRGKLSSYTRGGQFKMYPTTGTEALDRDIDFVLVEKPGITYSDANLNIFLGGGNPSAEIVANNGSGYMVLDFPVDSLRHLDRITIQGRTTAASTYFKMVIYDNHGNILWSKGSKAVTNMETWMVGIDLNAEPLTSDAGEILTTDTGEEITA